MVTKVIRYEILIFLAEARRASKTCQAVVNYGESRFAKNDEASDKKTKS